MKTKTYTTPLVETMKINNEGLLCSSGIDFGTKLENELDFENWQQDDLDW